ncbi:MAG: Mini-ribonuclease 3 [Clostridium sp.]
MKEIEYKKADYLSPLVWAYIGDAIYEIHIRNKIIENTLAKPHTLHLRTIKLVNAKKQSQIYDKIYEELSEELKDIARRARNQKNYHLPKNTTHEEYAKSTALEAVIGYLYINEEKQELKKIMDRILEIIDEMKGLK